MFRINKHHNLLYYIPNSPSSHSDIGLIHMKNIKFKKHMLNIQRYYISDNCFECLKIFLEHRFGILSETNRHRSRVSYNLHRSFGHLGISLESRFGILSETSRHRSRVSYNLHRSFGHLGISLENRFGIH